jgi:hypothetical protein
LFESFENFKENEAYCKVSLTFACFNFKKKYQIIVFFDLAFGSEQH